MIYYLILFLIILLYGTDKLINTYVEQKIFKNLNIVFWILYSTTIILLYYRELVLGISLFTLGILASLLIIFRFVEFTGDIKIDYSFWGLYVVSIFTLTVFLVTIGFLKSAYYKSPPTGDKGEVGEEGIPGNNSIDLNNYDLCYQQVMNYSNKIFYDWKTQNVYDNLTPKIENLYFKHRIKSICKSKNYEDLIYEKGVVNAIKHIQSEIRNIVLFFLSYKNGAKFLDDPVLNEYSWKDLLVKDKETISPIERLKPNKIWNSHTCLNYKMNIKEKKDSQNKCQNV